MPRSLTNPSTARTTRNAIDSPLLRIPGEIRNKIYRYSAEGYVIFVKTFIVHGFGTVHVPLNVYNTYILVEPVLQSRFPLPESLESSPSISFNLRSVCRQTRNETGRTASCHPLHTTFNVESFEGLKTLGNDLTASQRKVLGSIIVRDPQKFLQGGTGINATSLRSMFPTLQRVFFLHSFEVPGSNHTGRARWRVTSGVRATLRNYTTQFQSHGLVGHASEDEKGIELIIVNGITDSLVGLDGLEHEFNDWQTVKVGK